MFSASFFANPISVCPELVEGLYFLVSFAPDEGRPFDKLRANGEVGL